MEARRFARKACSKEEIIAAVGLISLLSHSSVASVSSC